MAILTLASWWTVSLTVLFILFSLMLILVILAQKPKGGGLAGAFGGAGGGQSAVFGAKTGDVLTYATILFFMFFLGLGISLVFATRADHNEGPAVIAPVETEGTLFPDVPAPTPTPVPVQGGATPATGASPAPAAPTTPPAPATSPAPGAAAEQQPAAPAPTQPAPAPQN